MILFLGAFVLLLLLGVPIALALGLSALLHLYTTDNLMLLAAFPQKMFNSVDNFVLLAVPLFLIAGNLMNIGGITDRVLSFAKVTVGHIRGGLSLVTIVASMFFGGVTGAAAADTSALGSILIPAMAREGYRKDYAVALLAVCAVVGAVIPPSITMVVYGVLAQVSVAQLFVAGIVPGVLIGLFLVPYAWWIAKRHGYPIELKATLRERFAVSISAAPVVVLPAIILGGIMIGIFTPTESAAVAVLYCLFLAICYRELKLADLWRSLTDAALVTAGIMFIIAIASIVQFIFSYERIPTQIAQFIVDLSDNKYVLLFLINVLLLILGMFLETISAMILALPILLEVAQAIDIDPVHFGTIVVINLSIGLATPPVGVCLFIACAIGKVPIEAAAKAMLPMIGISILVLMLVTYIPSLALFLPSLFFGE